MPDYAAIQKNLYEGNANGVKELVEAALAEGCSAEEVLNEGLIAGMQRVGVDFKNCVIYVPEVLVAARAMKAGAELLKPLLADAGAKPAGTLVIGTVKGDLHDIGKNLVAMMAEGAGLQVVDIGVDASPDKFFEAVKSNIAQLIGISALLTTTMVAMKDTITAISEAGIRDQVKVMVGGAPVTQRYSDEIGADGYAADASSAVDVARGFGA